MLLGLFCNWSNEALIFECVGQKAESGVNEIYSVMPYISCSFHISPSIILRKHVFGGTLQEET